MPGKFKRMAQSKNLFWTNVKVSTLLSTLAFSFGASADMYCAAGSCTGIPDQVIAWADGNVTIFPNGNVALTGTTCTPVNYGKAISLSTSAGQEKMYSMLLAAQTAKKTVFIRLPDNNSACEVSYIRYHEDT